MRRFDYIRLEPSRGQFLWRDPRSFSRYSKTMWKQIFRGLGQWLRGIAENGLLLSPAVYQVSLLSSCELDRATGRSPLPIGELLAVARAIGPLFRRGSPVLPFILVSMRQPFFACH